MLVGNQPISIVPLPRWQASAGILALLAFGWGCNGLIGAPPAQDDTYDPCAPVDVGMHRLTALEYDASLRDLLGITSSPSVQLPSQGTGPYDNNAATLAGTTPELVELFVDLSESVVDEAFTQNRAALVPCAPGPDCRRNILAGFARRAFRRPVSNEEIDELIALASTEVDFDGGIKLAMRAVISAPSFIYRIVEAQPDEPRPLDDYEIATRLSYFLFGTTPSDALLDRAAQGGLSQPEDIRAQIRGMLADPRVSVHLTNVLLFQFDLSEGLEHHVVDPALFPEFNSQLATSMEQETRLFISELLSQQASPMDLFGAEHAYVDERLASHYGLSGVLGAEFRRVDLTGTQRRGLLTQGSLLTATSTDQTSIVRRGLWILENAFCGSSPPPPANVPPEPDPTSFGGTRRELAEQHRADPACASCHDQIDPLGFALENFDATGRYRTMDNGQPIDSTGTLPDGTSFDGALELVDVLLNSPHVSWCTADHFVSYALGTAIGDVSQCHLQDIVENGLQPGQSLEDFVMAMVTNRTFVEHGGVR